MNYPYTLQIEDHFFKHNLDAKELSEHLTDQLMMYPDIVDQAMMNMLDSHDTARILTLAKGNQDLALQAIAYEFAQPGIPCIYYGTEMGMSGDNDPDCRKPMDWSKLNGPVWKRVHELVKFRLKHRDIKLKVTENGLLKVERIGKETINAYYNTSAHDVKIDKKPALSQNYEDGILAPDGFLVEVKA